jgi:DNA-binding response OmpR family regulator
MSKPLALIIEDDPQLNEIMTLTLETDFEIDAHADGTSGWKQLTRVAPALVVLDLNLPGTHGREILQYIRAEERLQGMRVIITTADERQAETLTNEADIVLLKPVSPAQLRQLASRLRAR